MMLSVITLISAGIDQATKWYAAANLPRGGMTSHWFDTLRIGYAENTGAFLGLGSGLSDAMKFWIFVCAVGLILTGLVAYILRSQTQTPLSLMALCLVFSGGISNFYDRLVNNGAVVDFLNLGFGSLRTGIFNVADMAIMLGVFFLLFASTQEPEVKEQ
jgi:signal peptidase II